MYIQLKGNKSGSWEASLTLPQTGHTPWQNSRSWIFQAARLGCQMKVAFTIRRQRSDVYGGEADRKKKEETPLYPHFLYVGVQTLENQNANEATPLWYKEASKSCSTASWYRGNGTIYRTISPSLLHGPPLDPEGLPQAILFKRTLLRNLWCH